jgi:hypothetical protein
MLAMLLTLACVGCDISQKATFQVQVQLQALYEEMAESVIHLKAGGSSASATAVLYTPDWVFVDASGQRQSLDQARSETGGALRRSPFDTITHSIQKLSLSGDQATVIVKVAVAVGGADNDQQAATMGRLTGWQELPDFKLPRVETTTFKDTWVKAGDSWKMKSREQLGKPDVRAAPAYVY